MSIKVLKPGLATSVQDAGREGHYQKEKKKSKKRKKT